MSPDIVWLDLINRKMNDKISFNCWKCGLVIENIPLPLSRAETCPSCVADLHVCRQCEYYDVSKASACREPIAEHVSDKTRANFCGYLTIKSDIVNPNNTQESDVNALGALFGLDDTEALSPATDEEAKSALDDLFGLDDADSRDK